MAPTCTRRPMATSMATTGAAAGRYFGRRSACTAPPWPTGTGSMQRRSGCTRTHTDRCAHTRTRKQPMYATMCMCDAERRLRAQVRTHAHTNALRLARGHLAPLASAGSRRSIGLLAMGKRRRRRHCSRTAPTWTRRADTCACCGSLFRATVGVHTRTHTRTPATHAHRGAGTQTHARTLAHARTRRRLALHCVRERVPSQADAAPLRR